MCSQCGSTHDPEVCPYAWLTPDVETDWRLQLQADAFAAAYEQEYPDYE